MAPTREGAQANLTSTNNVVIFGFNILPYFLSPGWPVLTLVIRQCLGGKGLRVEIVNIVLFISCSFYKKKSFIFKFLVIFIKKNGVVVQKLNLFLPILRCIELKL